MQEYMDISDGFDAYNCFDHQVLDDCLGNYLPDSEICSKSKPTSPVNQYCGSGPEETADNTWGVVVGVALLLLLLLSALTA